MNPVLRKNIVELEKAARKNKADIWKDVASWLGKPSRSRAEVNVSDLNRMTDKGEVVIVPGKVLGDGEIGHAVTVGAFSISPSAEEKIKKGGGKTTDIMDIVKANPKGKKVRIVV
jgi:large subunit ribosomal protein L18e